MIFACSKKCYVHNLPFLTRLIIHSSFTKVTKFSSVKSHLFTFKTTKLMYFYPPEHINYIFLIVFPLTCMYVEVSSIK